MNPSIHLLKNEIENRPRHVVTLSRLTRDILSSIIDPIKGAVRN